jgi:quercetin dioxygenase-like cupin family protein
MHICVRKEPLMKRTVVMLTVALAMGIALGIIGNQVLNAQQMPMKRTVLLKTDLPGMEGKQFSVDHVELAPGVAGGKHYHPGNVFVYVLEGSGVLVIDGQLAITQQAGSVFHEPPKQV